MTETHTRSESSARASRPRLDEIGAAARRLLAERGQLTEDALVNAVAGDLAIDIDVARRAIGAEAGAGRILRIVPRPGRKILRLVGEVAA